MRMDWGRKRLSWLIAASALAAGALTLAGSNPASAGTCQAWAGRQPPGGTLSSVLNGVSAASACDVWAVGYQNGLDGAPLIEHWAGGASWTIVPSPDPAGSTGAALNSVRMVSPTDGWAVGFYRTGATTGHTLILHWDGSTWTQVPSPDPGSSGSALNGVTVVSATDVWAVGGASGQALTLRWDGATWQQVATPDPGTLDVLYGVSALSSGDVWAVGSTGSGGASSDLALHWNGTAWSQVPTSPQIGAEPDNRFASVSADAPNDVWAVGFFEGDTSGDFRNVIEHWDGSSWTLVPITTFPLPNSTSLFLNGVTALSFSNVWAVGQMITPNSQNQPVSQPLVLHWNGVAWNDMTPPSMPAAAILTAADASSSANVWTVGDTSSAAPFATPLQLAPSNVQVAITQLGHTLYESGAINGTPGDHLLVEPRTSPAVAVNSSGQSEVAWAGANHDLWILDPSGQWTDTGRQLVAGSDPGIAALPGGGFEVVFANAADGLLWERGPDGSFQLAANGLGVSPGTSPAVAADASGKFVITFHANGTDDLWVVVNNTGYNTTLRVANGTSPAIAALEVGGYQVVFTNAADGLLWEQGPDGQPRMVAGGLQPEPGTSPAIAADVNGNFEIAIHGDNTEHLWTITPDGTGHDTSQVTGLMMDGTSPGITALPGGGFEVAYATANSGTMLFTPNGTAQDAGAVISADSSPSISAPAVFANAVLVPNVLDFDQASGTKVINAAGLSVGVVSMDSRCLAGPGTILVEDPQVGTRVALGSAVNLTVSTGRTPNGKPCVLQ